MPNIWFTVGTKGSGKSTYESRRALKIMNQYKYTEKKYPDLKKRIYYSNQKFAKRIEDKELFYKTTYDEETRQWTYKTTALGERVINNPTGHLYYWQSGYDLLYCPRLHCWRGDRPHPLHHADVFLDEVADHFPRDKWNELPEALRQCFSHARKRGCRWFANTQKYSMVAIDFRQQVDVAVWLVKLFGSRDIDVTLPDPKWVYVFQMAMHFNPLDIENEDDPRALVHMQAKWPSFHFYRKYDTTIFDTTFELPPSEYNRMQEVRSECIHGDKCTDPNGKWHVVKHQPI